MCVISKYLHSISGETPLSSRKEILGVMSAWNLHPTIDQPQHWEFRLRLLSGAGTEGHTFSSIAPANS